MAPNGVGYAVGLRFAPFAEYDSTTVYTSTSQPLWSAILFSDCTGLSNTCGGESAMSVDGTEGLYCSGTSLISWAVLLVNRECTLTQYSSPQFTNVPLVVDYAYLPLVQ